MDIVLRVVAPVILAVVAALGITVATTAHVQGQNLPITITKTDAPDPVAPGQNITYTITVNNPNAAIVVNPAVLTDPIPAGTTFVSVAGPAGWTCSLRR